MDFAALPPEINSGRMYAGPGAGPMLAAAAAWDSLAADLYSTATCYHSVISGLTGGPWLGPASASMAAAAATYVEWVSATAAQAEQAGAQAKTAVAAYESAFAMTVPPPVIAANRALLMALIATNFLGQNTPAIAATQAHYGEMWAQDAAAMYGYVGVSAAASRLTPFTPPAPTTNPTGLVGQAAAMSQAAGASAGNDTQTALSQLISTVSTALQGLAQPLQSTSSTSGLPGILQSLGLSSPLSYMSLLTPYTAGMATTNMGIAGSTPAGTAGWMGTAAPGPPGSALGTEVGSGPGALGSAGPARLGGPVVTTGLGRAATIGTLSVPPSWAATEPAIKPVAMTLASTSVSGSPVVSTAMPGRVFGESLMGTLAGRIVGGFGSRGPGNRGPTSTGGGITDARQSAASPRARFDVSEASG